jgi:inorganic pyrophosphatase/exopolyphosphatase
MEALRTVVLNSRSLLKSPSTTTTKLRICLGNVSVDMDSVVGGLSLAYYYGLKHQQLYIPVVNCKKAFFSMKLDINMHLEESKMPELIFLDEIDLERVEEVCLIDHNKLDST